MYLGFMLLCVLSEVFVGNTTRPTEATTRPSDGTSPTQGTTGSPGNGTTPLPNGCPVEGVDKVPNPGEWFV